MSGAPGSPDAEVTPLICVGMVMREKDEIEVKRWAVLNAPPEASEAPGSPDVEVMPSICVSMRKTGETGVRQRKVGNITPFSQL